LTGEPLHRGEITNLYIRSPSYFRRLGDLSPADRAADHYFWLHGLLGFVWA